MGAAPYNINIGIDRQTDAVGNLNAPIRPAAAATTMATFNNLLLSYGWVSPTLTTPVPFYLPDPSLATPRRSTPRTGRSTTPGTVAAAWS